MPIITGQIADIFNRRFFPGSIQYEGGRIVSITPLPADEVSNQFILPGFTDAHVHIESSMLVPAEFARLAVVHGTVSTISDPHEIANVCGLPGVLFMISNGSAVPFKFNFGAPSCVPATAFETAGAAIDAADTAALLQRDDILYLSEMMNFPGVLSKDEEVMQKLAAAKAAGKPIDGHAPGLRGEDARQYIAAGISTDHECFTAAEALEKLQNGMKILIREGSAAKNFDALIDLLHDHPEMIMFCSDDKHPDSLVAGHINQLCARAVARNIDVFNVLRAACVNPVLHYKTNTGLLRKGDAADFIAVKDLQQFDILETYINGQLVARNGQSLISLPATDKTPPINQFNCAKKLPADLAFRWNGEQELVVMEALEGQLITNKLTVPPLVKDGHVISDSSNDVLKLVVVNRYHPAPVAIGFIKNMCLRQGAIASSVAHDSHNIVATGADDESICAAVNLVIEQQGGISCVSKNSKSVLALPVAGLMSPENGYDVAAAYTAIDAMAKALGSTLQAPFMTLSFMALLVIPHVKLSDKGLFNGDRFQFYYTA
ncbi:MAG TPA: adenine deaminase [Chitinophagaceae bacterium]|nr:adenine deaminase [Chitinophagaceae bacterium]